MLLASMTRSIGKPPRPPPVCFSSVTYEPPIRTALQTMAIAGAAALAGVLIGWLVTS